MIDRFLQSLQGNKTYITSGMGIIAGYIGLNTQNMTPMQTILWTIACLIVMALRSALKTERGIHAVQSADYIVSELIIALKKDPLPVNPLVGGKPSIAMYDTEAVVTAVKAALDVLQKQATLPDSRE